jgi:hypothetical protein
MSKGTAGASRRDDRFDFMRGIALLIIFIDHVPKNVFEPFTLHAYAFCDAAEIFFFISGYVAAMVYGRTMLKKGFVAAAKKVWRRAGVVYGAQMLLLFAILILVPLVFWFTGDMTVKYIFRVQWVYENPLAYVLPALTMHYQPGYIDILPVYVLLLAAFPLVLAGLRHNVWLVLLPSFTLWLAVQVFGLTLWTTSGERWFFNPFAWQFLFVLGAVLGHPSQQGKLSFAASPILFWAAMAIVVPAAVIQMSDTLNKLVQWVPTLRPETMLFDKTGLGALRLVSFFALLVVARRFLPPSGVLSQNPVALAVIRCGRFSLQVFSFGVLLSSLTVVTWLVSGNNIAFQSLAVVGGVAAQIVYAAWRDKRREELSLLPSPAPVPVRMHQRER